MNPDQSRSFVTLLREYMRLQAEVRSLAAILTHSETSNQPASGWLEALKQMRETPEYRTISDEHEPLFVRIENAADDKEVELLLRSIPPAQYPN